MLREGGGLETYDHKHEVGETRFEEYFCGNVLDKQGYTVDGEVDAGIEGEELKDLGVKIDFCGEILDIDLDLADVH